MLTKFCFHQCGLRKLHGGKTLQEKGWESYKGERKHAKTPLSTDVKGLMLLETREREEEGMHGD